MGTRITFFADSSVCRNRAFFRDASGWAAVRGRSISSGRGPNFWLRRAQSGSESDLQHSVQEKVALRSRALFAVCAGSAVLFGRRPLSDPLALHGLARKRPSRHGAPTRFLLGLTPILVGKSSLSPTFRMCSVRPSSSRERRCCARKKSARHLLGKRPSLLG